MSTWRSTPLPGWPVSREHVDVEAVVPGERDRLRVQRHRLPRRDVPFHHGLGPVIHDRARHPAEVLERPDVAAEERRQVGAGGIAAERVPRIRQHHVEGVDLRGPDQHPGLLAPVHLRLRARGHREPAVQPSQRIVIARRDLRADLRHIQLHPLVAALIAVPGRQPLADHRRPQRDIGTQPPVDHPLERRDLARLGPLPRRPGRRHRPGALSQVLLHSPPVTARLGRDLGVRRARLMQGAEPSDVHPVLRMQDHRRDHPSLQSSWQSTQRRVVHFTGPARDIPPEPRHPVTQRGNRTPSPAGHHPPTAGQDQQDKAHTPPIPAVTSGRTPSDSRGRTRTPARPWSPRRRTRW